MVQLVIRALLLLALALQLAACQRGPAGDQVRTELQTQLDAALGGRVLQIESLRRAGSGSFRNDTGSGRVVYYNAELKLTRDYDFTKWDAQSVATLAELLGAGPKGITGLKPDGNQAGDLIGVHGSAAFIDDGGKWGLVPTVQVRDAIEGRLKAATGTVEQAAAAAASKAARVDVLNRETPPSALDQALAQLRALASQPGEVPVAERERIVLAELERAQRAARTRIEQAGVSLTLVAAPPGGAYAEVANALRARAETTRLPLELELTDGSVANIRQLASGRADFAFVQSDIARAAYQGSGRFAGTPQRELRAVASLFPETVHLVAREGSGITAVADLAGKRVNLGPLGSGTRANALEVLSAAGVDPASLTALDLPPEAAAEQLAAGKIDALFYTVHAPAAVLQRLAARTKLQWIPIPASDALRAEGLVPLTLPARTYPGQRTAVPTVAATALLVTRADVPAEKVVQIVRLLFEPRSERIDSAALSQIKVRTAREGVSIPWYPAAEALLAPRAGSEGPAASTPPRL
jgi:TRAP transporter TAXI family solute receptor